MKANKFLIPLLCLGSSLLFSACDDDVFGIRGEGEPVEEFRSVVEYDALAVAISANVYLSQGEKEEIRIVAQPNILENLETRVRDGKLTISFDRNVTRHKEVSIYLVTPDISEISVSGSGRVEGQNIIESEDLSVSVSGSGDVELEVETEDLKSTISGSGEIRYWGVAENHDIRVSGSGDIEAFELESQRADVRISGSGKAEIFVVEDLEAHVSGSGDVYYIGNPSVDTHISGSGKVKQQD